ncbi:MAG: winged helix-turn-helix transcriptional regulator [Flavisolibacter sp.]|jgi:DNA-binding MarR family transcriptional regulator|nr:winged helix-turn-helix transcriptional regulator [Flavisolibacter sp.]
MKTGDSKFCQCLYFTTAALARKVEKLAIESWNPVGLSPSHAYLLITVLEEPGVQPTHLGEHLQLKPSTITRLIQKLEEKKLVVRTTEGRITNVYPTPRAKELQPKIMDCMKHFYEQYSGALGKEESVKLVQSLTKVADKLEG